MSNCAGLLKESVSWIGTLVSIGYTHRQLGQVPAWQFLDLTPGMCQLNLSCAQLDFVTFKVLWIQHADAITDRLAPWRHSGSILTGKLGFWSIADPLSKMRFWACFCDLPNPFVLFNPHCSQTIIIKLFSAVKWSKCRKIPRNSIIVRHVCWVAE